MALQIYTAPDAKGKLDEWLGKTIPDTLDYRHSKPPQPQGAQPASAG